MWILEKKKVITQWVINKSYRLYMFLHRKKARKINEIIFWYIIETEMGKKWADSEKSEFPEKKNYIRVKN